jgi:hypothetical protein
MMKLSKVPKHLRPATRRWFRGVLENYELGDHHLMLLTLAGDAWDRAEGAREAIGEYGTVFTDRFGAPRSRPEVAIERDSRVAFARLIRELDLDIEGPPLPPGRPPALRSNRRV